jgi:hypothetical protein
VETSRGGARRNDHELLQPDGPPRLPKTAAAFGTVSGDRGGGVSVARLQARWSDPAAYYLSRQGQLPAD